MTKLKLSIVLLVSLISFKLSAQVEDEDASFSKAKYVSEKQIIYSKEIFVEEFMNYHHHNIPFPEKDEQIHMDLKFGNGIISKNGQAIFQIGFKTAIIKDFSTIPVANICFVVDKSGSMGNNGRLEKVKEAICAVINKLRPKDYISVIVYDTDASILIPNSLIGNNKEKIIETIKSVVVASSTNLNGGMVLGYNEAMKNFQKKGTNRLILLTDGLVNVGETNTDTILKNSKHFNDKGINISTIGIGSDVNFDLLSKLAKKGKGLSHFIGDADNFQKVFVDEVESQICGIAKDISLKIEFDPQLVVDKFYGYDPQFLNNTIQLELNNMNGALSKICLIRFNLKSNSLKNGDKLKVKVTFYFTFLGSETKQNMTKVCELQYDANKTGLNFVIDEDIKKNYAIAHLALSLKEAAQSFENKDKDKAVSILKSAISDVDERFPFLEDADILRVRKILADQLKILSVNKNEKDISKTEYKEYNGFSDKTDKSDVDIDIPLTTNIKTNTYAIIIGNEDYSSFQLGLKDEANAKYAVNDAYTFREYVNKTIGVPENQIRFLKNATAMQIKQALDWINNLSKIDNGEAELIFYYSGHGLPDQLTKEPYIIPVDVDGDKLQFAIKLDDVYSKLSEYPAKRITVFLDACFSGGARNYPLISNKGVIIKAKDVPVKNNMVVFCSSSGTESSNILENKYHGLYTYYLLKKIQDTKGSLSYKDLSEYIVKTIVKESALKGKSQTPNTIIADEAKDKWEKWTLN